LPPLSFSTKYIQEIQAEIPELPELRRVRFQDEYGLKETDIDTFVQNKDLGEYFEQVMSEFTAWIKVKQEKKRIDEKDYKKLAQVASNYILSDLLGLLRGMSVEDEKFLITPENFAEFIALLYKKEMTSKIAKIVLKEMFEKGADPSDVIKENGLAKMEDEGELEKIIKQVVSQNLKAVKDFKDGKGNALQFLIGQAMAETKGKASPEILKKLFTKALK
jgi:aspartyl-tRNA(Asn)/glutamyl-tRNA(Gln) amidotransferase subunit B